MSFHSFFSYTPHSTPSTFQLLKVYTDREDCMDKTTTEALKFDTEVVIILLDTHISTVSSTYN